MGESDSIWCCSSAVFSATVGGLQAVADLRLKADRLIKEVRDAIVYSTRNMDAASQRRVLRNHRARYYYLPDEKVDVGDETAVFELWGKHHRLFVVSKGFMPHRIPHSDM